MADFSKMTDDEFDSILTQIVGQMNGGQVLSYPGVYEVLREELNDDVLDKWANDNPDKAYGD